VVSLPLVRSFRDKYDEALTYPLVSTGQIALGGKLDGSDVVRSPIQAHLQLVLGTRNNRNGKPQGLEVTGVLIPRMAVALVNALIERRHAGGLG
jgi:hypothetical protein